MRRILRRKWLIVAGIAAAAVVLTLFVIAALALRGGALTARVTDTMAAALNCDVAMDTLSVRLFPRIRVSGTSLTIRLKDRPELPDFVRVDRFEVRLGLLSIVRRHIDEVRLDGLRVNVPPPWVRNPLTAATAALPSASPRNVFRVSRIVTGDATVNFVARRAGGRPLVFALHSLELSDAGVVTPVRFVAGLTNPIPEGQLVARGTFGPWNREDPTLTPLDGTYTLSHADLATINGIGGQLNSTGSFGGSLTEIHAAGTSETPDFSLDLGGSPVPLATSFQVTVDGTDGTTRLDRVEAHLANTTIVVTGLITNLPGPKNHDVAVNAQVQEGRIEDLMRLAFDAPQPIVTGNVTLAADIKLPPGPSRARDRIEAAGTMGLSGGHFTDEQMDAKLNELSRRGRGRSEDEALGRVATDFTGTFDLKQGRIALTKTEFHVPGATIRLTGTYTLGTEALDFSGEARLEASLSKAVGGFKSIFLKPFNPLFRKNGAGAVVPIRIGGTRTKPEFGVRMGAVFKGKKQ